MVPDALDGILCALENSAFGFRVVAVCRGPVAEIPNSLRVIRNSEFLAFVPELRILLFEFGFPYPAYEVLPTVPVGTWS